MRTIKLLILRRVILRSPRLHAWARKITRIGKPFDVKLATCVKKEALVELQEKGFLVFPEFLNTDQLVQLNNALLSLRCFDRYAWHKGDKIVYEKPADVPKEVRTIDFYRVDLLKIPGVLEIGNDPVILGLVQAYLGAKPVLSNVSCWASQPTAGEAKDSQYFHRDKDGVQFIKLFIYLDDVDEKAGPHCFIKKSHRSSVLLKRLRFSDKEVYNHFPKDSMHVFKGKAGTAFLEDTYGIHKGMVPTEKQRVVMQFQYSLEPLVELSYSDKIVGSVPQGLDSYINQCYFTN